MSVEKNDKDWIIELCLRPHQMLPIDPPLNLNNDDKNYSRLLFSIYGTTLGESFYSHKIDPHILEHIELEKECSEQDDLNLIWSDDVSLTLCFLASLAHQGEYSQGHLFNRYFEWWMNGYMCPTGLCFTPQVHVKKLMDSFGEAQMCEALGIEVDHEKQTASLISTPSAFLRISPIAYFYAKHSPLKRIEIIKDYVGRVFGKKTSTDIFINYIEFLVDALNGLSKEKLIESIKFKLINTNDLMNKIFSELIDLLLNDNNNIEEGIKIALEKKLDGNNESKYLNPFDSDQTILLTLYLQISGAIYNSIPEKFLKNLYAKSTIDCLIKWIIYQRNQNLHLI